MKLIELLQLAELLPKAEGLEIQNKDNKNLRLYRRTNDRFLVSNDSDNLNFYITKELLFDNDNWYIYFNNFNDPATTILSIEGFTGYIKDIITIAKETADIESNHMLELYNNVDELSTILITNKNK